MEEREVWFRLVDQDGVAYKETNADAVDLSPSSTIRRLRDAVHAKNAGILQGIVPAQLLVYTNTAALNANTADNPTSLNSSRSLEESEEAENEDGLSLGADEAHALLVVVPKQYDMNPSYFIEPSIQRNVKNSIFRIMDTANANKAIAMVSVRATNNDQEVVIQLRVVYRNTGLDFAILQSNHQRPFMKPWPGNPVNLRGCNLVLASFRIDMDPYQLMYQNEVGFTPASGVTVSSDQSHLLYWCATFAGDSGAALVMKGEYLVGIHEEVINALPEHSKSGTRSSKRRKIDFARAVTVGGLAQICSALLVHTFVNAFNP
ncbi:Trypsin-like cysteine/serine peptidase domain [Plasmopara halstedii]|uniref:Trypsin-like cysteine/serine peptidase domain n=1 Tax=Plasmopara halstedii TaxID=4781 RepID=A0A0P1B647_PLAHL|nr:Trypsin-like cysteine/serine peptidase domain [Plasmopara halstedii]CEG49550.1 Trypsin-like cysteine/serine peptidase domain [Plasmopara halstedii]|eukprot:XP_024585919.1 Trypsin-like cysteine/serine peptidase domain [Plasmopara halstedii]